MKRSIGTGLIALWLSSATGAWAQDAGTRAAAIADRDAAEERYRRLNTAVEGILASQAEQQRRLASLANDLSQLRADTSKPRGDFVTREELNQLVETIRELDRKREADRRMILEEIDNLGKSVAASLKTTTRPTPDRTTPPAGSAYNEVAEHKVEQGQTMSAIASAYNAEFKKRGKRTSLKLILDANPNIKPESMQVGQVVIVPLVPF